MKYYIELFTLLLFVGCIPNRCYTIYQIDNGEDYLRDGMRRIADRQGRIGYVNEKGQLSLNLNLLLVFLLKTDVQRLQIEEKKK